MCALCMRHPTEPPCASMRTTQTHTNQKRKRSRAPTPPPAIHPLHAPAPQPQTKRTGVFQPLCAIRKTVARISASATHRRVGKPGTTILRRAWSPGATRLFALCIAIHRNRHARACGQCIPAPIRSAGDLARRRPRRQSPSLHAPAPQPQTKRRGVRQPLCSIKQRRVGFSPRGASAAPVSKVRLTTFPHPPSPTPSSTSRLRSDPALPTPCYLARHGGWVLPHRRTQPDRAPSEQGSAWCLPAPASELMGQIAATRVSRGGLRAMLARRSKYPVLLPAAG